MLRTSNTCSSMRESIAFRSAIDSSGRPGNSLSARDQRPWVAVIALERWREAGVAPDQITAYHVENNRATIRDHHPRSQTISGGSKLKC